MGVVEIYEGEVDPMSDPLARILNAMGADRARVLRACAIPHAFDAVLAQSAEQDLSPDDVKHHVAAIARLSIVARVRAEPLAGSGTATYAVSPAARARLLREWLSTDAKAFATLNQRILQYLSSLQPDDGDAAQRLRHERIFHELCSDPERGVESLEAACSEHLSAHRPMAARAVLSYGREIEPVLSPTIIARIAVLEGQTLAELGDLIGARRCFGAVPSGADDKTHVRALLGIARLDLREGNPQRAIERYFDLLRRPAVVELQLGDGITLELGIALARAGRGLEAEEYLTYAIKTQQPDLAARAHYERGLLRAQRGQANRAIEDFRQGLASLAGQEMSAIEAGLHRELGLSLEQLDDLKGARAALEASLALCHSIMDTIGAARVLTALARVRSAQGDLGDAGRLANEAASLFSRARANLHAGLAYMEAGEIYREARAKDEARRCFEAAYRIFKNSGASQLRKLAGKELRTLDVTKRAAAPKPIRTRAPTTALRQAEFRDMKLWMRKSRMWFAKNALGALIDPGDLDERFDSSHDVDALLRQEAMGFA
jgi:tetratricopeptide (TPR) repeat protein